MWKYLHLPPLEDSAGRSFQMSSLLETDKKGQNNKARVTRNNKPRSRWFGSTLSCLHRLKERHFFGSLLPLPVTELTRKRALPEYLALLGLGKQVAVFNFSPGHVDSKYMCGTGKRAGDKGVPKRRKKCLTYKQRHVVKPVYTVCRR